MKYGIIGCGLIGQKRLQNFRGAEAVILADSHLPRAQYLAKLAPQAKISERWQDVVETRDLDFVVIATPHHLLAPITTACLQNGKHVLVEKPAALNADELLPLLELSQKNNLRVHVGFNHRYHRAFRQARKSMQENDFGRLMFLRGRYGHGGRLGMENEWRAQPELSGGGELIDQGVHMIDLSRWLLGDFSKVIGRAHTYFWPMPVDDNAFLTLETAQGQTAFLHVSCSEWKNTFSMEIYFERAKLEISGLGGSYGVERLIHYQMLPEMGPPETIIYEYPMADDSWAIENQEFLDDIRLRRAPAATLQDAYEALKIVSQVYSQSQLEFLK